MPSIPIQKLTHAVFKKMEDRYKQPEYIDFYKLNASIGGFNPGKLALVIGKPDTGKTEFCIKMVQHFAVKEAVPTIIFSPTMSAALLTEHIISSISGVKLHRIKSGFMDDNDWSRLTEALGSVYESDMYINDSTELTIEEIRKELGTLERGEIKLAIIDCFNTFKGEERAAYGESEMRKTAISLKKIAQDFNISVIAVFQALRTAKNIRLNISDLSKYGITEDVLDTAILINKQHMPHINHHEKCACDHRGIAEISVWNIKDNIKTEFSFYIGY